MTEVSTSTRPGAGTPGMVDGSRAAEGCGAACGTFGELLQGMLPDNDTDFLVTLPITRRSSAYFRYVPKATHITVWPAAKTKSRKLAELMLRRYGRPGGGILLVESRLPEGKGQASSSADLVATARAIGDAIRVQVEPFEIESLLALIEPSDGVMYPGVVAFAHRQVRLLKRLGGLPRATIVGIDEGGQIDTLDFNRRPKQFTAAEKREYHLLLGEIADALAAGDLAEVGRVSTRSAVLNQRLGPKARLGDMMDLARATGSAGVVAAHSGTILGLMFADSDERYTEKVTASVRACRALAGACWIDHTSHDEPLAAPAVVAIGRGNRTDSSR
jgi:uncharacterized protein involved in propanediol utilization